MRKSPPTVEAIFRYWKRRAITKWQLEVWEGCCWACRDDRHLQRCHIIPKALGGKNHVSNFMLLCANCHREAPNTIYPEIFVEWVKNRENALAEYFRIFNHMAKVCGIDLQNKELGLRMNEWFAGNRRNLEDKIAKSSVYLPGSRSNLVSYLGCMFYEFLAHENSRIARYKMELADKLV